MGIFKDNINLDSQYGFLLNLGFKYNLYGKEDYIKTIHHNEIETLWITVNPKERKVYLYNEWDCGGELWSRDYNIPQSVLENEEKFIDWLDEKIGSDEGLYLEEIPRTEVCLRMDNDLISRNMVLELLDREISNSKEMESKCDDSYKNGFRLKQIECQNIKELVSYLPSFNETLESVISELEQLKTMKEHEIQKKWECESERATHVAYCTSEEYQNAVNIINIIKKYIQNEPKEDAENANPANKKEMV